VLTILAALAVLYALGRSFVSALGEAPRAAGPQAVLFSAPEGYAIEQAGEVSRVDAARRLQAALERSARGGTGIHFTSAGSEIYWLVDRDAPQRIVERVAGANGTRMETEFRGDLAKRIAWAAEHGTFDAPGSSAGESRNLYH
jgi:hypothetical protein